MDCESEVGVYNVTSTADASHLAQIVNNCSGGANYSVNWFGKVDVETTISLSDAVTLDIVGLDGATINGAHSVQLFTLSSANLYVTEAILENGNGTSGGAIWAASYSTVELTDCNITGNNATSDGGAIALSSYSLLVLEGENMFHSNSAAVQGGAVYVEEDSRVLVPDKSTCTFLANVAYEGGALASYADGSVDVFGEVHVRNNTSTGSGGGIFGEHGNLSISGGLDSAPSSFVSNSAGDLAGALLWRGSSQYTYTLDLVDVLIEGNTAENAGGAYCSSDLILSIEDSRFVRNVADVDGGALIMQKIGLEEQIEILNCTFQDNYAKGNGGAVVVVGGVVTVVNSTFSRNEAGETTRWVPREFFSSAPRIHKYCISATCSFHERSATMSL